MIIRICSIDLKIQVSAIVLRDCLELYGIQDTKWETALLCISKMQGWQGLVCLTPQG